MINVDQCGHLVSSASLGELHSFARRIGLKREWFQNKRIPHYDLTTRGMIDKAVRNGAEPCGSKDIVKKAWRERL